MSNAALLEAVIPGAQLAILRGAGHTYWLEQPDRCRALIGTWSDGLEPVERAEPPGIVESAIERATRLLAFQIGAARGVRTALAAALGLGGQLG